LLEDNIKKQYKEREGKESLYHSVYAVKADEEKLVALKDLMVPLVRPDSTVLEIGAGQGGNVDMLRACGFATENIYLNELLPERLQHLHENYPNCTVFAGNALNVDFGRQFDCVFQSTVFTSLLNNDDRKKMAQKMWSILKPGGVILWYDFIYNNPANPAVRKVSREEVMHLFSEARESEWRKITLAPPIGRRVGRFYNVFNWPVLRTHLLAVLKKNGA